MQILKVIATKHIMERRVEENIVRNSFVQYISQLWNIVLIFFSSISAASTISGQQSSTYNDLKKGNIGDSRVLGSLGISQSSGFFISQLNYNSDTMSHTMMCIFFCLYVCVWQVRGAVFFPKTKMEVVKRRMVPSLYQSMT